LPGTQNCNSNCNGWNICNPLDFCGDGICGFGEDVLSCPQDCPTVCGDGVKTGNEQCDGNDFGGYGNGVSKCLDYSSQYSFGNLNCTGNCVISTSNCVNNGGTTSGTTGGTGGIDVTNGLVLRLKFDDSSSDGVLDSSLRGNNGFCTGNFCPSLTQGVSVKGSSESVYTFDGINDGINFTSNPLVKNEANGFSSSLWFSTSRTSGKLFERLYGNFEMYLTNDRLNCRIRSTDTTTWVISTPIIEDTWYHAVCTFDPSAKELKLYVNGIEVAKNTFSSFTTFRDSDSTGFGVGWRTQESLGSFFDGKMDDLRIYNRPLTASEVGSLYSL